MAAKRKQEAKPKAKVPVKPKAKKPSTKKPPTKAKVPSTKKPKAKVSLRPRGSAKGSAEKLRRGKEEMAFTSIIEKTQEEIEQYLCDTFDPFAEEFDLPTPKEMAFCDEWLANGYNATAAMRKVNPDGNEKAYWLAVKAILEKERVQNYLRKQINDRRIRLGITSDWIAKKYLYWSTLDITKFVEMTPPQNDGRKRKKHSEVRLKKSLEKLPPLIRQSIKSLSVDKDGQVKVEFIDQKSALDSLSKLLGFTDSRVVDLNQNIKLHFDSQDSEA